MKKLLAHEALIVAIDDIWNKDAFPSVHVEGVSSENLMAHKLTRDFKEAQLDTAIRQAREAGWLIGVGPGIITDLGGNWSGLGLSNDGLAKVADLTRPWWRTALASLGGDVRTVIVGGISGAIGGIVAGIVIALLA